MRKTTYALLAVIPLLVGCCPQCLVNWQMEEVQDRSEMYQAGFEAGCNSGYRAGESYYHEFDQDAELYVANVEYKAGWDNAFQICKKELDDLRPWA